MLKNEVIQRISEVGSNTYLYLNTIIWCICVCMIIMYLYMVVVFMYLIKYRIKYTHNILIYKLNRDARMLLKLVNLLT